MEMSETAKQKSIEVFCCYAHEDQLLLHELKVHMTPLQREGLITLWADVDIDAGTEWEREIHQHLNASRIILLLVSPDFMASDYCYGVEMQRAMGRHKHGEARVIPIILRPVSWQGTPFGKLHALPTNATPITSGKWHHQDEAFYDVVEGMRNVLEALQREEERRRRAVGLEQVRQSKDQGQPQQQTSITDASNTGTTASMPDTSLSVQGQKRKPGVIWGVFGSLLTVLLVAVLVFALINSGKQGQGTKAQLTPGSTATTPATTSGSRASAGSIREFSILTSGSNPTSITRGSDGNLWFVEKAGNKIGRITPQGHITEFAIPTPNSITTEITLGSDGNLWFFENGGNKIGRITPGGDIIEYQAPAGSNLVGITSGPDGNLWFTEFDQNKIGRMTTSGVITGEFTIPTPNSGTETMSAGPDGNVWFVEDWANKIGRITPQGHVTEFNIPIPLVAGGQNYHDLTAGPDGNLWLTEGLAHKIGRITPQGSITEFPIPLPGGYIGSICAGPDGALWLTDDANHIARMTTSGTFTNFYPIPTPDSHPAAIIAGPDKNIWFVEYGGNKIGQTTTGL